MTPRIVAPLLAQTDDRTYFEISRLSYMEQWWQWPLMLVVAVVVVVFVIGLYRRDTEELPRTTRWTLSLLRLSAFAGLFVFFLGIEKRTEHRIFKSSRAVVAFDTSQSMELADADSNLNPDGQTRAERAAQAVAKDGLLDQLRTRHDLVVYGFDESDQPNQIASLPRTTPPPESLDEEQSVPSGESRLAEARWLGAIALAMFVVSAIAWCVHTFGRRMFMGQEGESWGLLVAVVSLIMGMVFAGVTNLRHPEITWGQWTGSVAWESEAKATPGEQEAVADSETTVDWRVALRPSGAATKLGDVIQTLVERERGGPIAGICLLTDGNSNAGTDWREALDVARNAEIPLYPIGLGTDKPPVNVRIVDIEAPARVHPGDAFSMSGFLQAYGLEGQTVSVELIATEPHTSANQAAPTETVVDSKPVRLPKDGTVQPVEFEVLPEETGRIRYIVRVRAPSADLDARDNQQTTDIRVMARKNRVLLLASGPTREYRFLRVLCHRDREVSVDVMIQGSSPEISQEANAVLEEFPTTPEEMFEYDCVVAFDPDWLSLSDEQIRLLERWVAEKAGGLILIAGPVYTPEWTSLSRNRPADEIIKGLYPVSFYRGSAALFSRGRYASAQAWPLEFSPEGNSAQFLWLEDTATENELAWSAFPGVYGFQTVRGAKPASTVYARFSNPNTTIDGESPVFMAGQFYGAGRVFYLGSGEMWRLHAVDTRYFEDFYTKLVRYISEGRLLRDSSRGVLLVNKDRCIIGETIVVRASLSDAQFKPLTRESVEASLFRPDGIRRPLTLRRIQENGQEGTYTGQFTALSEGDFRIELAVPDSPDLEILDKIVRARLPDREVESPQRNDSLLSELAQSTGGTYYVGVESAIDSDRQESPQETTTLDNKVSEGRQDIRPVATDDEGAKSLLEAMIPQDQETYFLGAPDKDFQQSLMTWLMTWICGSLSIEWLVRRLHRLA